MPPADERMEGPAEGSAVEGEPGLESEPGVGGEPGVEDEPGVEGELSPRAWVMSPVGELEWTSDTMVDIDAVHPDDAAAVTEALRVALETEQPYHGEVRLRAPNDDYHWVEIRAWPVHGATGLIEHWVGVAIDIEARRRSEALLHAVESPASPFALIIVDRDFRLLRVNLPPSLQFPYDPSWLEGRRMADAAPDVYEQVREVHERILAGGRSEVLEITRTAGSEVFHRLLLFYPARVRGELIGVGIVDIDITDRKRAELAVAELAEERRGLLQALVQMQERERRRIAADIHADTLQVLGAVRLKVDALGGTLESPEQRAALADIEETFDLAAGRLRGLLFELWPPSLERTGLAETVSELLANCERDGLSTRFEADLAHEVPLELRGVIYRVIAEALTNVRRHAHASSVEVELGEAEGGLFARIRDDGVGFDPRAAPSGHFGLREMSDRVHAAGGTIEVRSEPGRGTEIRLSVPCAPPDSSPAPLDPAAPDSPHRPPDPASPAQ